MRYLKTGVLFSFIALFLFVGCAAPSEQTTSGIDMSSTSSVMTENGFDYVIENDAVKITEYQYFEQEEIIVPEEIAGKPVKTIGKDAFYQHTKTTSIVLPQNLEIIDGSSFYRCYSLKEIVIPKNVKQIRYNPFFRASSLTKITVDPNNAYYCDIDGVLYNKDVTQIISYPEGNPSEIYTIPDTVTAFRDSSPFGYHCRFLRKLVIPSSVVDFPEHNMFIFPDDITLVVESGSAAEQYAQKHELKYELVQ